MRRVPLFGQEFVQASRPTAAFLPPESSQRLTADAVRDTRLSLLSKRLSVVHFHESGTQISLVIACWTVTKSEEKVTKSLRLQ